MGSGMSIDLYIRQLRCSQFLQELECTIEVENANNPQPILSNPSAPPQDKLPEKLCAWVRKGFLLLVENDNGGTSSFVLLRNPGVIFRLEPKQKGPVEHSPSCWQVNCSLWCVFASQSELFNSSPWPYGPPMHDENDLGRPCIFCSRAISWRLWRVGEAA